MQYFALPTTQEQNLALRWVPQESLHDLWDALKALDLAEPGALGIANIVSCPGTDSCKLGITSSMGLAKAVEEEEAIEVEVVDNGPGIPAPVRARLFEPFFTTREKGSGLGLAIAKEVVEGHGGRLSFETRTAGESDAHKPGTTFQIEIPVSPSQAG